MYQETSHEASRLSTPQSENTTSRSQEIVLVYASQEQTLARCDETLPEQHWNYVSLDPQSVTVWERSAGLQTAELYDALEHVHAVRITPVKHLCALLECESPELVASLTQFFAAGALLSDLIEALEAADIPFSYGTCTSNGERTFRAAVNELAPNGVALRNGLVECG